VDRDAVRDAIENLKARRHRGIFSFSPTDHTGLDLNAFEIADGQGWPSSSSGE